MKNSCEKQFFRARSLRFLGLGLAGAAFCFGLLLPQSAEAKSEAPSITIQPAGAVATIGQSASVSVTASGTAPLAYQWLKDDVWLPGQTNSSVSFASFQFTNSGSYRVVITNAQGMMISRPASLSVPNAPLQAWGYNSQGQLGNGTITSPQYGPTRVASNVVAMAAGGVHSLFVKADGTLWAMGGNHYGELGNGTTSDTNRPVVVANNVVAVAAGGVHSLFVKGDGTLWAMGRNHYGQLGIGNTSQQNSPVSVASNVVAVAVGYHSLFVKADGTLWAMGYNNSGQLGDGTNRDTNRPVVVASNVVAVAAGSYHSLFVKADGTLWAMGFNSFGALGAGNTTSTNRPVVVASNVVAVAAGQQHSLFVKADGTLWAMGENAYGQLGNGNISQQNSPVSVASNVVAVAAGADCSLFVKADGTLWAMGVNAYGQLGNGNISSQNLPVMNMNVFSVASLGAMDGARHSLAVATAKTLATVALSSLTPTYDGTAKPVSVVTAPTNLTVSVTYNGSATVPASVDRYTVVATIADPNYYGDATATLVIRTTPTVTHWPAASAIFHGRTLASSTLSGGSASVAGTFGWTAPGTAPGGGTTSQGVTFTPADAGLYDSVTGTANVTALVPPTVTTVAASGRTPGGATLNAVIHPQGNLLDALFQYDRSTNFAGETIVSTLAGAGQFNGPWGVAVDASGTVYVADTVNNCIFKVTAAGVVTTLAGSDQFNSPQGVAVDASGNVYVADVGYNCIFKVTAAGVVTTLADQFYSPQGVAVDASGNVYVADVGYNCIFKVTVAGEVTTLAGPDQFSAPYGVAVDASGNVYVADVGYNCIFKVTAAGEVTTLAGPDQFNTAYGVAVDASGNVYVADSGYNCIFKVTAAGVVTTLAGLAVNPGYADGTAATARFDGPSGVAVNTSGNVYVADYNNNLIRKITPLSMVSLPAQSGLAGTVGVNVNLSVTGLAAQTTYYFRAVATNNVGWVYGEILSFTTLGADATPSVTTWPTASAIAYGQSLASSTLSGGSATVDGTFAFTTPTTAPAIGTASQSVTFTPVDTTDYVSVTGSVNVTVNPALATLEIRSPYGMGTPAVGSYTNALGTALTNSMANPEPAGGTQYVCTGWSMAGGDPASGATTQCVMMATNSAVLTWLWATNYWLETACANGSVNVGSGWQPMGVTTQIVATANPYYSFTNWTGSAESYTSTLELLMDSPQSVRAHFAAIVTANTGTPRGWLAQHGLTNDFEAASTNDTDHDGMNNAAEYVAGTDPTNITSLLGFTAKAPYRSTNEGQLRGFIWYFPAVEGRVYDIEAVNDLGNHAGWALLPGATNLTGFPTIAFTNLFSQSAGECEFYRIGVRLKKSGP